METRLWLTSSNHSTPLNEEVEPSMPTMVRALTAPNGAFPVTDSRVQAPAAFVVLNQGLG